MDSKFKTVRGPIPVDAWSQLYYRDALPDWQHRANNEWLARILALLNPNGVIVVPNLQKLFMRVSDRAVVEVEFPNGQ